MADNSTQPQPQPDPQPQGDPYTEPENSTVNDWHGQEVQADMDRWRSFYPAVTGIFFDEMSNKAGLETYYAGLTAYAKSRGADFTVATLAPTPRRASSEPWT